MSQIEIPTYVGLIPLPAPVTSGTTVQSYTDPNGDVWVAKNGVYGGNWNRAREVLYGRVFRNAAYTFPTAAGTNFPWNAVTQDLYGMWSAPTFIVPIAGLWQYDAQICVAFTAAAQFTGFQAISVRTNTYSSAAGNMYCHLHDTYSMPAGTTVGTAAYTSVALAAAGLNNVDNYFTIKYVGTG